MALVNDDQLTALAESIVPAAPSGASAEQTAARNEAVANVKSMLQKSKQYTVDYLEIQGIETSVSTSVNVASVSGVTPGVGASGPGTGTGSGSESMSNAGRGLVK